MKRYGATGQLMSYADHALAMRKVLEALKEVRSHLADYSRRSMFGSECDEDVKQAQAVCAAILADPEYKEYLK
jgi:hypothetical protein